MTLTSISGSVLRRVRRLEMKEEVCECWFAVAKSTVATTTPHTNVTYTATVAHVALDTFIRTRRKPLGVYSVLGRLACFYCGVVIYRVTVCIPLCTDFVEKPEHIGTFVSRNLWNHICLPPFD